MARTSARTLPVSLALSLTTGRVISLSTQACRLAPGNVTGGAGAVPSCVGRIDSIPALAVLRCVKNHGSLKGRTGQP